MLDPYKNRAALGVLGGVVLMFSGSSISGAGGGAALFQGIMTALAGWLLLIWGCINFAKAKGHSSWFGLLGLLLLPGLIIIALLNDKHR